MEKIKRKKEKKKLAGYLERKCNSDRYNNSCRYAAATILSFYLCLCYLFLWLVSSVKSGFFFFFC